MQSKNIFAKYFDIERRFAKEVERFVEAFRKSFVELHFIFDVRYEVIIDRDLQ
jgi:hypothetical protein